jgi:DHA2 family multidrug resistance protein-like MFS transporter
VTAVAAPAPGAETTWRPSDRWLLGVVLAVVTFWLFAQTLLNVIPGIQGSLGLDTTVANLAVSVTALMSGLFIVVFGGLADRVGRGTVLRAGIVLSIVGSLLIALTPAEQGALTATMTMAGRIVQGLSAACVMPSSLALIKDFYDDGGRERALSFWSIGSWGGSGFCALFGGLMAVSFLGWRSIFWISIAVAVLALYLIRDTPQSRAVEQATSVDSTGPACSRSWWRCSRSTCSSRRGPSSAGSPAPRSGSSSCSRRASSRSSGWRRAVRGRSST